MEFACVDLKELNKFVVRERYLSPTPLEVVSNLPSGAKYFTVVDAVYHQVPLDPASQELTTFITPFGRYMYKRAPFGLSSISEHYNRRMAEMVSSLTNTHHVVDDVIIADTDLALHVKNVHAFLEKCHAQGVTLNREKFRYAQSEVTFAGFQLSERGYTADPELVSAIKQFPVPKNVTDLRSLFGLMNQLGSFSDSLSALLEPFRPLLHRENEFTWTDEHSKKFAELKAAMCDPPFLAFYDPRKSTTLYADASRINGLGFVLKQLQTDGTWRMVRAGSRCLSSAESRYAMIELARVASNYVGDKKVPVDVGRTSTFRHYNRS